jgi:hypothetical protein
MDIAVADPMTSQTPPVWAKELIPDDARLFMRVHKNQLDADGEPIPGAFRNRPQSTDGMSTDWEKYSSPEECRNRARNPTDNAVIQLKVEDVRQIPEQIVEHTPIYQPATEPPNINRSHTDVYGEKDAEVRLKLMRIYRMAIRLEDSL